MAIAGSPGIPSFTVSITERGLKIDGITNNKPKELVYSDIEKAKGSIKELAYEMLRVRNIGKRYFMDARYPSLQILQYNLNKFSK